MEGDDVTKDLFGKVVTQKSECFKRRDHGSW